MHPSSQNASTAPPPEQGPRPKAGGFLKIRSYSKLNLFLDVVARREDGYHDIESVMQLISLADEMQISVRQGGGVSFSASGGACPRGHENIICRAAAAMIKRFGIQEAIDINLYKRIPMGAGLGGGSGNCAATIRGINDILGLSASHEDLHLIAKSLGADVPFFLTGGTCLANGIGEKLTQLQPLPICSIVLVYPEVMMPTNLVYNKLMKSDMQKGNIKDILHGLALGDLTLVARYLYNTFQDIVCEVHPVVGEIVRKLTDCGALGASMTGTGSAVFGIFASEKVAKDAQIQFVDYGRAFLVRPILGLGKVNSRILTT